MKKAIFYFSGTGNGLNIAKELASRIEDCEVLSIAKAMINPNFNVSNLEIAGVITPVYGYGAPQIVEKFCSKIAKVPYIFTLAQFGTNPAFTLTRLGKIIAKNGGKMNGEFYIKMPENFIPIFDCPSDNEINHLLGVANSRFDKIASIINSKKNYSDKNPTNFFFKFLGIITRAPSAWGFYFLDYFFTVNKPKCTSCSMCAKVCPVDNIKMVADKNGRLRPKWKHHCTFCISCLANCPTGAIELGPKTIGQRRYVNPKIKSYEFIMEKAK